jgi:hypothetical protein
MDISPQAARALRRATRRVGRDPVHQARWLLEFAWADLDKESVARTAGWELEVFLRVGSEYAPPSRPCVPHEVRASQAWLRKGLKSLILQSYWLLELPPRVHVLRWPGFPRHPRESSDEERPRVLKSMSHSPSHIEYPTKFDDPFLVSTSQLDVVGWLAVRTEETLLAVGARFRVCERDDCCKPFIARKRQAYCSPSCSQAVRTERYRTANPERARQLRRAAYVRKVKAGRGTKVRVGTRRRSQTENLKAKAMSREDLLNLLEQRVAEPSRHQWQWVVEGWDQA